MARIFFDEGSQRSYVRTAFANKLNLAPTTYEYLTVHGFGGKVTEHSYGVTDIGLETPSGIENVRVLITDEIVQPLQQYCLTDLKSYPRFRDLPLANDYKDNSFTVDILLGADAAYRFLGNVSQENSHPLIQESKFGYVLSGPLQLNSKPTCQSEPHGQDISSITTSESYDNASTISFENLMSNTTLFHQTSRLFQDQFVSKSPPSTENSTFLHSYRQKIEFRNGSYYAPLPWKIDHPPLPSNLNLCKQRLVQVTSRLNKLGLMDAYRKVMAEHLSKGYIEEVPNLQHPWPEEGCHYLPHFFVLKDSETTPLRIVFAANTGHVSLNDCLYTGPCLLNNLVELLLRFRFPQYAFIADIQRAFLNIRLHEADRPFVRFLWYKDNDPSKELCVYTYNTIVFGHTSSPMTLAAVLLEHFQQYNDPVAVDLSHKLYVDNLLSGVQTEAEATAYFKKAREIMQAGHFVLRQWSTNSPRLRKLINIHDLQTKSDINPVLGLLWNSSTDSISFQSKCFDSSSDVLTKRKVLSLASQLFDPLGLVLPVTVLARLFLAELWDEKFGWDQPLPSPKMKTWMNIEKELSAASQFEFSRWIAFDSNQPVSLHVFTDASKSVIGSVAYLSQQGQCVLLGSKSKLSPRGKKTLTIPQLELSAMLLGSQFCANLLAIVKQDFPAIHIRLWTDSEIALHWLSSPRRLKQFVQNKVDAINRLFGPSLWGHTPSTENPADLVSRGCSAQSLFKSSLWLHGPSWILNVASWPQWPKPSPPSSTVAASVTEQQLTLPPQGISSIIDISRFNTYSRLLAASVYVHRFCFRTGIKGTPTASEINSVEIQWIRAQQQEFYPQVLDYLSSSDTKSSHAPPIIRQLNLFLDEHGLIRTKGRFALDSSLILLPRHSRFIDLLVLDSHERLHHIGVGGTIVAIRQRFWIPSVRSVARRLLHKCSTCKRVTGRPYLLPTPSELPQFRMDTSNPPFSNIGIDFTGHFLVKDYHNNHRKVYICLFTCLTTRAISLELVEDLTTLSFLQAFRRHCSIFSTPRFILADNAQTFRCAEQNLAQLLSLFDSPAIQQTLAHKRITFRYIPARSPHWGGAYERLIGLTKTCLKKVLGRSLVTFSELSTLLKEIQAVLNDRPLTYINSDIHDLQPLTPSQLLFGYNTTPLPYPPYDASEPFDPTFGDKNDILRAQTRRSALYHHFSSRFCKEYLSFLREIHSLHHRKQAINENLINVGDIVLVADMNKPRHHWELGLVQELILGTDKLCRAAVVRTSRGRTTRSIIKLYPLEINARSDTLPEELPKSSNEKLTLPRRSLRKAAFTARDAIAAQLIDTDHD